jgi:hypothetical protein
MGETDASKRKDAYGIAYNYLVEMVKEKGGNPIDSLGAVDCLAEKGLMSKFNFSLWTLLMKLEWLGKVRFSGSYSDIYVLMQ